MESSEKEETNEINEVMRLLDEDPSLLTPRHLDVLIAMYRDQRANFDAGVKPKRKTGAATVAEGRALLDRLKDSLPPPTKPTITRRV